MHVRRSKQVWQKCKWCAFIYIFVKTGLQRFHQNSISGQSKHNVSRAFFKHNISWTVSYFRYSADFTKLCFNYLYLHPSMFSRHVYLKITKHSTMQSFIKTNITHINMHVCHRVYECDLHKYTWSYTFTHYVDPMPSMSARQSPLLTSNVHLCDLLISCVNL